MMACAMHLDFAISSRPQRIRPQLFVYCNTYLVIGSQNYHPIFFASLEISFFGDFSRERRGKNLKGSKEITGFGETQRAEQTHWRTSCSENRGLDMAGTTHEWERVSQTPRISSAWTAFLSSHLFYSPSLLSSLRVVGEIICSYKFLILILFFIFIFSIGGFTVFAAISSITIHLSPTRIGALISSSCQQTDTPSSFVHITPTPDLESLHSVVDEV